MLRTWHCLCKACGANEPSCSFVFGSFLTWWTPVPSISASESLTFSPVFLDGEVRLLYEFSSSLCRQDLVELTLVHTSFISLRACKQKPTANDTNAGIFACTFSGSVSDKLVFLYIALTQNTPFPSLYAWGRIYRSVLALYRLWCSGKSTSIDVNRLI